MDVDERMEDWRLEMECVETKRGAAVIYPLFLQVGGDVIPVTVRSSLPLRGSKGVVYVLEELKMKYRMIGMLVGLQFPL